MRREPATRPQPRQSAPERSKAGSDQESLAKARALLLHADSRTTLRIYRRKPERV